MDKVTRILMLYSQLIKGHIVSKEDFCREYEVTQRSFDRDIEDIRLFLSEAYSGSELRYDRKRNGYFLTNLNVSKELTSMEIILLLTILRESRALRTDEFDGLTESVIETSEQWKKKETKEIAKKIKEKYQPVNHKKALMKLFWDLQMCIYDKNVIILRYIRRNREYVQRRVYPLEIIFSEHYFYLVAVIQKADYEYPAFYRLDRIESFQITMEIYGEEIAGKYKKLQLHKKLKYMQGGEMLDIIVCCENEAKENLLDVFEESTVIKENEKTSIIQIQAIKEGFIQWVLGQKENVIVLQPEGLQKEICKILESTLKKYQKTKRI